MVGFSTGHLNAKFWKFSHQSPQGTTKNEILIVPLYARLACVFLTTTTTDPAPGVTLCKVSSPCVFVPLLSAAKTFDEAVTTESVSVSV